MEEDLGSLTDYNEDGVDLTLIRWMLSLTPVERLDFLQSNVNALIAIRELMPEANFGKILRLLTEGRVRFVLVGMVACAMNGAILATFNLDIVPARDPKNVNALLRVLNRLDAIYRRQPGSRFKPESSHLSAPGHHKLITNCGPLELLGAIGSGLTYHDLMPDTIEVEIDEGYRVRMLSLAKILELKEELRRDKDLAMLPTLRQTLKEKLRGPG